MNILYFRSADIMPSAGRTGMAAARPAWAVASALRCSWADGCEARDVGRGAKPAGGERRRMRVRFESQKLLGLWKRLGGEPGVGAQPFRHRARRGEQPLARRAGVTAGGAAGSVRRRHGTRPRRVGGRDFRFRSTCGRILEIAFSTFGRIFEFAIGRRPAHGRPLVRVLAML